ncbi:MAG: FAD-binding oxidoreductase [Fimbriimonadaceae bacterium]|jgi:hypothetical protein|nr:FAD-binding oxidoreductase [Fimbriimonadaceae bacterium]
MSLSHWEYDTYFRDLDVAVIGGGIVGLNAAWALRRARPDLRVVVFERGSLPYGASTRNAGFACFGSVTEVMDDLERMPEAEVRALMARRYQGLRRLRENLGDDAIGYEPLGGWELFADDATMSRCLAFLPTLNAWAAEFTGQSEAYADGTAHLAEFGFGGTRYLIHNRAEGLVHTGHMMDALMRQSVASGVSLCHGAWVERMDEDGDGVELHTQPFGPVRARRAVVCTNGFARQLLPALDVTPARAQVLVTDPIPGLRFRGAFHFDEGYYYFRNVGDQVLFGGARNLDFAGETTTEMVTTGLVQDRLERCLREIIIPGVDFRVQRRWSGIMGLGPTKSPIVQALSGTTVAAVRMGGMGVALGTLAGEEAATLSLGTL